MFEKRQTMTYSSISN